MKRATPLVTVFGEVLFDRFSDGSAVLGGAPFNVAWNLQALGQSPRFVSRVGRDEPGELITSAMERWGLDTTDLQRDASFPTGAVVVTVEVGEPRYDIVADQAYDHIAVPEKGAGGGLLYHGTLALRQEVSRQTLETLRAGARVFVDVNLRAPWWQPRDVLADLEHAAWVKLNADELELLAPAGGGEAERAAGLMARCSLQGLIVTRGSAGAAWYDEAGRDEIGPGDTVKIADTVGAGDAFAAVALLGLVRGWPRGMILARARDFAAAVVGLRGATTENPGFYQPFIRKWKET